MTDITNPQIRDYFNAGGTTGATESSHPAIKVDFREFLEQFKECGDLSEDQQLEIIQIYWNIAMQFVKIGYGLHPVQAAAQVRSPCGKAKRDFNLLPGAQQDMLHSEEDSNTAELGSIAESKPEGGTP